MQEISRLTKADVAKSRRVQMLCGHCRQSRCRTCAIREMCARYSPSTMYPRVASFSDWRETDLRRAVVMTQEGEGL